MMKHPIKKFLIVNSVAILIGLASSSPSYMRQEIKTTPIRAQSTASSDYQSALEDFVSSDEDVHFVPEISHMNHHIDGGYRSEYASPRSNIKSETFNLEGKYYSENVTANVYKAIRTLRDALIHQFETKPDLFLASDIQQIIDSDRLLLRYLNQREGDIGQAHKLAVQVLAWRNENLVDQLIPSPSISCDLFGSGLIFEHKNLNSSHVGRSRSVIWVRLGAINQAIKALKANSNFSTRRAISTNTGMAKASVLKVLDIAKKTTKRHSHQEHPISDVNVKYDHDPRSIINEPTMQMMLHSIVWWLNDWDLHHPMSKATLVLDFEGDNTAFTSSSLGSFFIQLDDRFPDMFDEIIAYRYKRPKNWSLHDKVGLLNKIFFSKIVASSKTNKKIKFVETTNQIENHISDHRLKGQNVMPEHVLRTCIKRRFEVPEFCLALRNSNVPRPVNINSRLLSLVKESLVNC